jgi:hypothetical protein
MHKRNDDELGVPPSVVTIEMFDPKGKRQNFEQFILDTTRFLELKNQTGNTTVIRFWSNRQSERNFPLDPDASKRYSEEVVPTIPTGIVEQTRISEDDHDNNS